VIGWKWIEQRLNLYSFWLSGSGLMCVRGMEYRDVLMPYFAVFVTSQFQYRESFKQLPLRECCTANTKRSTRFLNAISIEISSGQINQGFVGKGASSAIFCHIAFLRVNKRGNQWHTSFAPYGRFFSCNCLWMSALRDEIRREKSEHPKRVALQLYRQSTTFSVDKKYLCVNPDLAVLG
jgi:hypothetical protein